MSQNLYRKQLENLKPYVPGKTSEELKREYGLDEVVKLASNENPLGPSPKAVEAVKRAADNIHIYPDNDGYELKIKLEAKYGVAKEQIVLGNGGTELIKLLAETFIDEGDEAVMPATTFGRYGLEVAYLGGKPVKVPLKENLPDYEKMLEMVNEKTKLFYICNPNNPTGNILPGKVIAQIARRLSQNVVFVLDEAYYDFATRNPEYGESLKLLKEHKNLIILRTFSKIAGLAGVRIGYIFSSDTLAGAMNKCRLTFNVNSLALAAAVGALDDEEHVKKAVNLNYESLELISDYCDKNHLDYIPSNANFIFVDTKKNAEAVFQGLLRKGVIVKSGTQWGRDTWIRISTGTIAQTKKCLEKLSEVLGEI